VCWKLGRKIMELIGEWLWDKKRDRGGKTKLEGQRVEEKIG